MKTNSRLVPILILGLIVGCGTRPSEFTAEEWASYSAGNPKFAKALEWIEKNPKARIEKDHYLKWHKKFFLLNNGANANYLRHGNGLWDAITFDIASYGYMAMVSDTADHSLSSRIIHDYSEDLRSIESDLKIETENGSPQDPKLQEHARLLREAINEFEDLRAQLYAIPKDR